VVRPVFTTHHSPLTKPPAALLVAPHFSSQAKSSPKIPAAKMVRAGCMLGFYDSCDVELIGSARST
jgi:hypothetical protein